MGDSLPGAAVQPAPGACPGPACTTATHLPSSPRPAKLSIQALKASTCEDKPNHCRACRQRRRRRRVPALLLRSTSAVQNQLTGSTGPPPPVGAGETHPIPSVPCAACRRSQPRIKGCQGGARVAEARLRSVVTQPLTRLPPSRWRRRLLTAARHRLSRGRPFPASRQEGGRQLRRRLLQVSMGLQAPLPACRARQGLPAYNCGSALPPVPNH